MTTQKKIMNTPCSKCGSTDIPLHTNGVCGNCYVLTDLEKRSFGTLEDQKPKETPNPNIELLKDYMSDVCLSDVDKAHLLVLSKTLSDGQLKAIVFLLDGVKQIGFDAGYTECEIFSST